MRLAIFRNIATATEAIGATELMPSLLGKTRDGTTREELTSILDLDSLNKDLWQCFLLWLIFFLSPPFRKSLTNRRSRSFVELGIKAGKDETLGRVCRYMHVWASPMVDEWRTIKSV